MTAKKIVKLDEIEILNRENCHIQNKHDVENKINELINGGAKKLQIISDFDLTITKQHLENGEKIMTSFNIFFQCQDLPTYVKDEAFKLLQKYRPIEIDPNMAMDEKIAYMIEWWSQTGDLLKGFEFKVENIDEITKNYKDTLRDGTPDLLKDLYDEDVPVLVFSAGLGDSVVSVLKHFEVLYPNVKVVSNFLQFREGCILNGLQEKMIHTFNKNEHALEGTEYYDIVRNRDHVIVMGDSLGDAEMANGVPAQSHVLKIGFLYDHPDQNLPAYKDKFDIVLIDDQTMDLPRTLFKLIRSGFEVIESIEK